MATNIFEWFGEVLCHDFGEEDRPPERTAEALDVVCQIDGLPDDGEVMPTTGSDIATGHLTSVQPIARLK